MGIFNMGGRVFSGSNISIINGRVIIDGKEVSVDGLTGVKTSEVVIRIEDGSIGELTTDASVTCGAVTGNVTARGSVNADSIGGNVDAGGSVNCDNVSGSVDAGGSVNCGKVGGNIKAGGSVFSA